MFYLVFVKVALLLPTYFDLVVALLSTDVLCYILSKLTLLAAVQLSSLSILVMITLGHGELSFFNLVALLPPTTYYDELYDLQNFTEEFLLTVSY